MWLDLKDVIEIPGAEKPFETVLDTEHLCTPAIRGFSGPVTVRGAVRNTAGLLYLRAPVHAQALCVCDRCGTDFVRTYDLDVDVPLAPDAEDDNGDAFPLDGDGLDVAEVLETCFALEVESKLLCRPDCRGLCPVCGKNLNDGPCGCVRKPDPRFAVLEQLLDREPD